MGSSRRDDIVAEMRKIFGSDQKRIKHALDVLSYADKILAEEQGDTDVVTAAAILHDIGIHEAERKYSSNAGRYQEIEGPPIAERILKSLGFEPGKMSEICDIIAHHHSPRTEETTNFKILYDADRIVNIQDTAKSSGRVRLTESAERSFLTTTGLSVARDAFGE